MKRTYSQLADSDDDVDSLPLLYISSDHHKHSPIEELKKFSPHACDFCEKRFENRYDHLVHNAKHIIIPLMKTLPYYCVECGLYSISEEEMNEHMSMKHKMDNSKSINQDDGTTEVGKCEIEVQNIKEEPNEDDEPLCCLIKKEEETELDQNKVDENILQNFMMNCKVDIEKFVPDWKYQSDEDDKSNIFNINEDSENSAKFEPYTKLNDVVKNEVSDKSNLVNSKMSTDDINIVKTEVDNIGNPVVDSERVSDLSNLDEDPIIILPIKKEIVNENGTDNDSIHFNDLIKPGMFYCKRCFKRFPTRYEVIIHEVVHLDMSEAASVNNKVKHKPVNTSSSPITKLIKCRRCNEEISYKTEHAKSCFTVHCPTCAKAFKSVTALEAHEVICNGEAIVNMCGECFYLRKRPKHLRYCRVVKFDNLKDKRICHWCGKVRDTMYFVTLISNMRLADRIRFENDLGEQQSKDSRTVGTRQRAKRGSKILSKWERLKLIQSRLKSMKK